MGDIGWEWARPSATTTTTASTISTSPASGRTTCFKNNGNGTFADVTAERAWATRDGRRGHRSSTTTRTAPRPLRRELRGLRLQQPARVRQGQDLPVQGRSPSSAARGSARRGRLALPKQRRRDLHRRPKKAGVSDPNGYYGMGVICSDFDEDGLIDIFVANDSTPNFLYHNNGDGTFKEIAFCRHRAQRERQRRDAWA